MVVTLYIHAAIFCDKNCSFPFPFIFYFLITFQKIFLNFRNVLFGYLFQEVEVPQTTTVFTKYFSLHYRSVKLQFENGAGARR